MLLDKVKEFENELNGWVMDHENDLKASGDIYLSPIRFYLKNDFEILNEIRLETEIMSAVKIKWSR